ncbi:c-type cytochrome [Sulfurisoma sediminicola]|uniref:Cytochrome c553 n=1 Tax=Sulfurisoma sediminicola TaxID=1381557 RepID=A0A497XJP9_9PROT|nr:c-type cytochrome [Sulfurisoma sediminicola]RLJ67486.1 cytochrome c553 [Sulfurisoma sediminicola]
MRLIAALTCAATGAMLAAPAIAADPKPAPASPRVQEIVAGRCSLCHGMEGESASPVFPRLAAQHPEYMVKQLKDFREGRRKGTMNEMAADLKDDEIAGLASYFGGKPSKARRPSDVDLAGIGKYIYEKGNKYTGVAACASCHGPKAYGTVQLPRLAGQNVQYLETQLKEFNQRARTNDNAVMHSIASKLTELETVAVSSYIAGLE